MYEAILTSGVSDSKAASLAKVSTSAVWRWKQEIPKFAEFLKIARAKFEFAQIKTVRDTKCRDPRDEVRNAKWLLQNSNPEVWGGRSRKPPVIKSRHRRPVRRATQRDENAPSQQSNDMQFLPGTSLSFQPARCDIP